MSTCKAITKSGTRCTRGTKYDGYCTEKHRDQALGGGDVSSPSPSAVSNSEIVKTAKVSKAKKSTPAPRKTRAKVRYTEQDDDSDDGFSPYEDDYDEDDSTDEDYDDNESEEVNDDDDVSEEEDELADLTESMAATKIDGGAKKKATSPATKKKTTRTRKATTKTTAAADGQVEEKDTNLARRFTSRIFNTGKVLAPPTKFKSQEKKRTGFWVPAPPVTKIPDRTLSAFDGLKQEFKDGVHSFFSSSKANDDTSSTVSGASGAGGFKYQSHVHRFLMPSDSSDDPDSKRGAVKKLFKNIFSHKSSKDDTTTTTPSDHNKPLPPIHPTYDNVDTITSGMDKLNVQPDLFPNQCQGYNTDGHRCQRKVKVDGPTKPHEVLLCHNHEVNDDDQVVVNIEGQGGVLLQWLDVAEWVNPTLPVHIQRKLRMAMERAVSETDKPGYIYSYQLESSSTPTHTLFKIGRTDNVTRRMNEWGEKCGSPPILKEVFPDQGKLAPKSDADLDDGPAKTNQKDNEVTGLRCRYSHRVERLIHIELKPYHDKNHVCACKTAHREWFMVPHKKGLTMEQQHDAAWAELRKVVVHWMAYMERVYGPG